MTMALAQALLLLCLLAASALAQGSQGSACTSILDCQQPTNRCRPVRCLATADPTVGACNFTSIKVDFFGCEDWNVDTAFDYCLDGDCIGSGLLTQEEVGGVANPYLNSSEWLLVDTTRSDIRTDNLQLSAFITNLRIVFQEHFSQFAGVDYAVIAAQFRVCFEYGGNLETGTCLFPTFDGSSMDVNGIIDNTAGTQFYVQIMEVPPEVVARMPANLQALVQSANATATELVRGINAREGRFNDPLIALVAARRTTCAQFNGADALADFCPDNFNPNLARNLGIKLGAATGLFLLTLLLCFIYYACKASKGGEGFSAGYTTESTASMQSSSASSSSSRM